MLARESRRTIPKPSPGAKTAVHRDEHFVTRTTTGGLILCSAAKDLLVEPAMIAKKGAGQDHTLDFQRASCHRV
jgi:hypothetical protein